MISIEQQAKQIVEKHTSNIKHLQITGVNKAAMYLQGKARQASPSGDKSNPTWKAIKTTLANSIPKAAVYIDFKTNPVAVYIHERRRPITVSPKTSKYLYIPITAEGRQHTLHARDAEQKRLKGFLGQTESGHTDRFIGYTQKDGLDYVLKRTVTIPASKYAGYLTNTAKALQSRITSIIRETVYAN